MTEFFNRINLGKVSGGQHQEWGKEQTMHGEIVETIDATELEDGSVG